MLCVLYTTASLTCRPLITTVQERFKRHWVLGKDIAIDEAMVGFLGANPFRRCLPNKPQSTGFKLYTLCCSTSSYCKNFTVDTQKGRTIVDICATLTEGLIEPNMICYTDRFYTSVKLAKFFRRHHCGLIGTLQANRCPVKAIKVKKSELKKMLPKRGDVRYFTNRGKETMVISAWRDTGVVRWLSTSMSTKNKPVQRKLQSGVSVDVPAAEFVGAFNLRMGGVDRMDQMRSLCYGVARAHRTSKWWLKLFFGIWDIAMVNSWVVYRHLHPALKRRHFHFAWQLAAGLVALDPNDDRTTVRNRRIVKGFYGTLLLFFRTTYYYFFFLL